ncbi:hypothetical protein [Pedobacter frigoris]|uniref:hypothetical protein n=1 Tax=Pedobacter frigoris TaxID=2571272 RepID=UPI0029311BAB|nr:hypothetical protein [Pedobacter frigoris]
MKPRKKIDHYRYQHPMFKHFQLCSLSTALLIFAFSQQVPAQKLPKLQTQSLRAPKNVLIDGKLDDWKDGFMAFNSNTSTYYSIANDSANIYLIIKSGTYAALQKMLFGGITLTLQQHKIVEKDAFKISYPIYDKGNPNWFVNWDPDTVTNDKLSNGDEADSVIGIRNTALSKKMKFIAIRELATKSDTIFSVYNAKGVVIRSRFDRDGSYIAEWSIPTHFLMVSAKEKVRSVAYRIELPGRMANSTNINVDTERRRIFINGNGGDNYVIPLNSENLDLSLPTYFKGTYILAN